MKTEEVLRLKQQLQQQERIKKQESYTAARKKDQKKEKRKRKGCTEPFTVKDCVYGFTCTRHRVLGTPS